MTAVAPWSERIAARWRPRLTRKVLGPLALGLAIGAVGGFAAEWLHVPLAWMLGPLFLTMIAALAGAPAHVPNWMRLNFLVLIGLFLGESFDGLDAATILQWPISMIAAALYLPVAVAAAFVFYARVSRLNGPTAFCAAIPGGLTGVTLLSGSLGADERRVALAHSLRIAIVVVMAPAVAIGLLGFPAPPEDLFDAADIISMRDFTILLGTSVAVMGLLRNRPVPMAALVVPLTVSGILRMTGVVEGIVPHGLVEIALLVVGASIGTRFAGEPIGELVRFGIITLGGTAVLMAVSVAFAASVSAITGIGFLTCLLSYAPGGVAEMSLIAHATGADAGFVAVHHLVRIVLVHALLPVAAGLLVPRKAQ